MRTIRINAPKLTTNVLDPTTGARSRTNAATATFDDFPNLLRAILPMVPEGVDEAVAEGVESTYVLFEELHAMSDT